MDGKSTKDDTFGAVTSIAESTLDNSWGVVTSKEGLVELLTQKRWELQEIEAKIEKEKELHEEWLKKVKAAYEERIETVKLKYENKLSSLEAEIGTIKRGEHHNAEETLGMVTSKEGMVASRKAWSSSISCIQRPAVVHQGVRECQTDINET